MKSHKRRSRIVAGFALLAASAAVATALAAPVAAQAAPNVPIVTSADASGHATAGLPLAEGSHSHGPRRVGKGRMPKRPQVAAVASDSPSSDLAAAPRSAAQTSASLVSAGEATWQLEYARAASIVVGGTAPAGLALGATKG